MLIEVWFLVVTFMGLSPEKEYGPFLSFFSCENARMEVERYLSFHSLLESTDWPTINTMVCVPRPIFVPR